MARSIETLITISAPRARVWSVLMDFAAYPDWNPFIRSISGPAKVGEGLDVSIQPPGHSATRFGPRVIEVVSERCFAWRGTLPIPGLFTGEHRFTIEDSSGKTVFCQMESFSGLLVPFVGSILAATEEGFRDMNAALKARAEVA